MKFRPNLLFALGAALLTGACATAEFSHDRDAGIPVHAGMSYGWATEPPAPAASADNADFDNELTRRRLRNAIDGELQAQGLAPADVARADFVVSYKLAVSNKIQRLANPDTPVMAPVIQCNTRACWSSLTLGYAGPPPETKREIEYREGSLIVDLQQRSSNRLAWRGIWRDRLAEPADMSEPALYKIVTSTMKGLVQ